jgi:hypothetical protein
MEYMGMGKPAVAPDHTAMMDYVREDNSFIVGSNLCPDSWPHDSRKSFRAMSYSLDWDSIRQAYLDSYKLVTNEPDKYLTMCKNSVAAIEAVASEAHIHTELKNYLTATARKA